jgi:hypothetical protein
VAGRPAEILISTKTHRGPAETPAFFVLVVADAFIPRSRNKPAGTRFSVEHRMSPAVVGAGNANTREEKL